MNKQSRQLLNFLKKQNQMLKDDISQLKQILKINKQALQVSLIYKKQQDYEKVIPPLIKLLYEQNTKLHVKISQLKKEIQLGLCQALISEQIAFASTEQQIMLTNELKDKLTKLRKQLQSKENKIIELTKMSLIVGQKQKSSVLPDFQHLVEYTDMNKVTKRLKDSMQKLTYQLDMKKQQVQKLKDGKQELFKLNLILTKQVNQLKLLTSGQTTKSNHGNQWGNISISSGMNNDLTKYIKYQKKILNDDDQNIYDDGSARGSKDSDEDHSNNSSSDFDQDQDQHQFDSQEQYNENQKHFTQEKQDGQSDEQKKQEKSFAMNKTLNLANLKGKQLSSGTNPKMNLTLNLGQIKLPQNISKTSQPLINTTFNNTQQKQSSVPKMMIPKLELTKAKQIQTLIVKKINNDEKKKAQGNNPTIKQQKYRKLQQQLQALRKKFGNEMMIKLSIERELVLLKRMLTELQNRNSLLVQVRIEQQQQDQYVKQRQDYIKQNKQTLLDICRDVTLNNKLRNVISGKQQIQRKYYIQCQEC